MPSCRISANWLVSASGNTPSSAPINVFAWMEDEPLVRVSPDLYLLDFIPERPLPASWQTGLPGHRPPRLALEIVSESNWRKGYREAPAKYARLGAGELVVFDPGAVLGRPRLPQRTALRGLQHFHCAEKSRPELETMPRSPNGA